MQVLLYKLSVDCGTAGAPATLEQLDRIPFPSAIRSLAMDGQARMLAISGDAKCVTLWALNRLQERLRDGYADVTLPFHW